MISGMIKGLTKAEAALFSAAKRQEPRQGYLFTGSRGCGKKTLAALFAKALLCESPWDGGACGKCKKCIAFDGGNNADYLMIKPAKKALSVDEARGVRREVYIRPYYSAYKVFVFDKAGNMSVAAQNALLKTIEEPPDYAVFILLAETSAHVLETIRSRLLEIIVTPTDFRTCANIVRARLGVPIETANAVAALAGGSIGEALRLAADNKFLQSRDKLLQILSGYTGDYVTALDTAKWLSDAKDGLDDALSVIAAFYIDNRPSAVAVVAEARRRLSQNVNTRLTLENMMMEL